MRDPLYLTLVGIKSDVNIVDMVDIEEVFKFAHCNTRLEDWGPSGVDYIIRASEKSYRCGRLSKEELDFDIKFLKEFREEHKLIYIANIDEGDNYVNITLKQMVRNGQIDLITFFTR